MTSAISKALDRSRALISTAHAQGLSIKQSGLANLIAPGDGMGQLSQWRDQAANRQRYSLFRGWVYAAVNALAMEGAAQPVKVGKMAGAKQDNDKPKTRKDWVLNRMTKDARSKAANEELEVLPDHWILDVLERPNPLQHRWQFTYSFIANLCLTGWAFVVHGEGKDGTQEFYSLPTTWIRPDHSKGAFAEFKIVNPNNPASEADAKPISGKHVAFAHLPNPSNPMSALSPAQSQSPALKIDDYIQSSQQAFFENGIFPSVIITMGSNPHPDAPGGTAGRPRLTAQQRRQVYAAIRKVSGGIANYGNPAIVDGLIEKIDRLSATQNEMGWEKSENKVRTRILSAFGVHPFILGEEMAGSYAQAYIVQDRFHKKVNTFLDMLGICMTNFADALLNDKEKAAKPGKVAEEKNKFLIWWEECKAVDPSMEKSTWEGARNREDVTQNEFRAYMGLPPDEDSNQAVLNKSTIQAIAGVAEKVQAGAILVDQAVAILEGLGVPTDLAERIAGPEPPEPEPQPPGLPPAVPGAPPAQPGMPAAVGTVPPKPGKPKKPQKPEEQLQEAQQNLKKAMEMLELAN